MTACLEKIEAQVSGLIAEVTVMEHDPAMLLAATRAATSGLWAVWSKNYTRLVIAKRELEDVL